MNTKLFIKLVHVCVTQVMWGKRDMECVHQKYTFIRISYEYEIRKDWSTTADIQFLNAIIILIR